MAFDDLMFITRYFFRENYKVDKAPTIKVILLVHILLKELFENRLMDNKFL